MNVLLKNGIIVNSEKSYQSDILISGNKISEISEAISGTKEDVEIVEASGCYIFPGGIDPHVHLHLPSLAGYSADDFQAWFSVLQKAAIRDGGRSSGVDDVNIGSKPSNGAQVKSLGIERLLKSELDSGEVFVIEMNESEPLDEASKCPR